MPKGQIILVCMSIFVAGLIIYNAIGSNLIEDKNDSLKDLSTGVGTIDVDIFLNSMDSLLGKSDKFVMKMFGPGRVEKLPQYLITVPGPNQYKYVEHETQNYFLVDRKNNENCDKLPTLAFTFKDHLLSSVGIFYRNTSLSGRTEQSKSKNIRPSKATVSETVRTLAEARAFLAKEQNFNRTHVSTVPNYLSGKTELERWKTLRPYLIKLNTLTERQITSLFGPCFYDCPKAGGWKHQNHFSMSYRLCEDISNGHNCRMKTLSIDIEDARATAATIEISDGTIFWSSYR